MLLALPELCECSYLLKFLLHDPSYIKFYINFRKGNYSVGSYRVVCSVGSDNWVGNCLLIFSFFDHEQKGFIWGKEKEL